MPRTLREARWRRECAPAGDAHADAEVTAWGRMAYGVAKVIAHYCGVSASRVHNWMAGEQPSPLTQLRRAIDAALDAGRPMADALAPVELLCDRYLVRTPGAAGQPRLRLVHSASLAIRHCGEAVATAIAAAADGTVSTAELSDFEATLDAARRALEMVRLTLYGQPQEGAAPIAAAERVGAQAAVTA